MTEPAGVRPLFTRLRDTYPAGTAVLLTVVLADDPWAPELSVGIDGDMGVLRYADDDQPAGVYSHGTSQTNARPVVYYYVIADTSFPTNTELPLAAVEAAVVEFMTTGGRPTTVEWQVSQQP